ncbi:MAG: ATP-binding protein [Anaerovoracaceae bacterium]
MELNDKRIRIIVGHYGSGKTEFAVNYAVKMAELGRKTSLVDLDIANTYFRSRERQALLEDKGVLVYSNTFGYDITADLPAISSRIRAPLEDVECNTIVDAGGDDSGARILVQFKKYFTGEQSEMLCVINANRPETSTVDRALSHITRIEKETSLKVSGIVNNTHLIKETVSEDILKGYELARGVSKVLKIPIKYNCCVEHLVEDLTGKTRDLDDFNIFPIKLYMRENWMDRDI